MLYIVLYSYIYIYAPLLKSLRYRSGLRSFCSADNTRGFPAWWTRGISEAWARHRLGCDHQTDAGAFLFHRWSRPT